MPASAGKTCARRPTARDKEKLTFTLVYPPFDTALLNDLERVSDAWLADKGGTEKGFSLGRFDAAYSGLESDRDSCIATAS